MDTPGDRARLLAGIARGYQLMAEERTMMLEMCKTLATEQKEIQELLEVAKIDIEELCEQSSSDDLAMTELLEKIKTLTLVQDKVQPLVEKAAELCSQASRDDNISEDDFGQLFQDLLVLKERKASDGEKQEEEKERMI